MLNDNQDSNGYSGPINPLVPARRVDQPHQQHLSRANYTGSINTVVLGTGSNTVTALGGLSTVVLGATVTLPEGIRRATFSILTATGKDTVTINGS